MKITHVSAIAVFALASVAFAAHDGVTLKRVVKPNTSEVYKLEQKSKMNISIGGMDIEQESSVGASVTVKYLEANDKGEMNLTQSMKLVEMKMTGPGADGVPPASEIPAFTQKGTISSLNIVTLEDAKMKGMVSMALGSVSRLNGIFVTFSDKAVNAGDSWDMVIPKSPATLNKEQKMKVTYVGMKDGQVQLKMTGVLEYLIKMTADDIPNLPSDLAIKGASTVTADILVDPATGQTLETTMTMKDKATMDMSAIGMTGDSTSNSTVKITLQKPKA